MIEQIRRKEYFLENLAPKLKHQELDKQKLTGKNHLQKGCMVKNSHRDVAPLAICKQYLQTKGAEAKRGVNKWTVYENVKPQMKIVTVRTRRKKWSFPLRISSVSVTKFGQNFIFCAVWFVILMQTFSSEATSDNIPTFWE